MKLTVYLNYPGTCKEAFKFYQSILGGEITAEMRYEGSPMESDVAPEWRGKIMHACLHVGGMDLMASDGPPEWFVTPQGYHISIQLDDPAETERVFSALSEGGQVTMPLEQTFWAKRFGMLTDRFGIGWMVNCE